MYLFFFFFSSRRRHTRFSRDWSSDVCSSDLNVVYDLKFEGFKNLGANDTFTFSYTTASACSDSLGYTASPMTVTNTETDGDSLQSTSVGTGGALGPPFCIKLADAANDN